MSRVIAKHDAWVEGWNVTPAMAKTVLAPLVDWTQSAGPDAYFSSGVSQFRVEPSDNLELVLATLSQPSGHRAALKVASGTRKIRVLHLDHDGFVGLVDFEDGADLQVWFGDEEGDGGSLPFVEPGVLAQAS